MGSLMSEIGTVELYYLVLLLLLLLLGLYKTYYELLWQNEHYIVGHLKRTHTCRHIDLCASFYSDRHRFGALINLLSGRLVFSAVIPVTLNVDQFAL